MAVTKIVTKLLAPDVTAQIFFLKNRDPKRWSDRREVEANVKVEAKVLTEAQLMDKLHHIKAIGNGLDIGSIEGGGIIEQGTGNEA